MFLSQLNLYELLIGEVTSGPCIGRFIESVLKVVLLLVLSYLHTTKTKLNQPETPETRLVDDIQTHPLTNATAAVLFEPGNGEFCGRKKQILSFF